MKTKMKEITQKSDDSELSLGVVVKGMTITVKAGFFRFNGEDLEVTEDIGFKAAVDDRNVWLDALLVKQKETGAVTVLVDELVSDGITFDQPYEFEGGSYEPLLRIYSIPVVAGVTSLENVELQVFRMQKMEAV